MTEKKRSIWDILLEANGLTPGTIRPRIGSHVAPPVKLPKDFTPPARAWDNKETDVLSAVQSAKDAEKANYRLPLLPAVDYPRPVERLYPSITTNNVTGNLDDLVVGIDPANPPTIIAAAVRKHNNHLAWLDRMCEDEEGRALVQAILDRKKKEAGK